ncbi:MAG: glycogen-debranching protein [Chloroflexi bacterium]|nr:glycogen-debranching protein [Chloroflexota bacterium]
MDQRLETVKTGEHWQIVEGVSSPLGVTWMEEYQRYNFALYSRHATGVTLLLYTEEDPVTPVYQYQLNYLANKTGPVWHCSVPATTVNGAALYAYRVDGPGDLSGGHRFDSEKILLDPYAPSVFFPPRYSRAACAQPGPTDGQAPLGVLPVPQAYFDWGEDRRPRHTYDTIIYELHVKGFTARANSGVSPEQRGTFAGLVEKIPYLQELGVTVVELMPIHQFDPQEGNYWGYMTLNFFTPHHEYVRSDAHMEFRAMVKAFHAAGMEVWLDVVYNHTSEGAENGPTYCYRGVDNHSYYLLAPDRRLYLNDTGCGNTTRCAHPAVRALIVDSLTFWAEEMHVDGFRFDLASIFSRNNDGSVNQVDPPLIAEISYLANEADVRLVAEAWDIGSYQLGRGFPGINWLQWNGEFRDEVRSLVKGDPGYVGALMARLYGSDDLFPDSLFEAYRPYQSVNFVTAHDGFCLYDLVAYNDKHNEANGHNNSDGTDDNRSWNCGWEGDEGTRPEVLALRRRQVKNFCTLLLLANGIPMIVAGDEFMNTQWGNNNPYNQDNEITWLDWDLLEKNRDIFRFFKGMIAFRKAHPSIGRSRYWREDVRWYGVSGPPDLRKFSHTLAYFLSGAAQGDDDLYVMINVYWNDLIFAIQEGRTGEWLRVADTSLPSPDDLAEAGQEMRLDSLRYCVKARSVGVLRRSRKLLL